MWQQINFSNDFAIKLANTKYRWRNHTKRQGKNIKFKCRGEIKLKIPRQNWKSKYKTVKSYFWVASRLYVRECEKNKKTKNNFDKRAILRTENSGKDRRVRLTNSKRLRLKFKFLLNFLFRKVAHFYKFVDTQKVN